MASGHFSPAPIDCSAFSTVSICKKHVCYAQYWGWTRLECLIVPGSSTANLVLKLSDPRKPVFGIRGPLIVPGLWSSAIGTRRQWISFNKSDLPCSDGKCRSVSFVPNENPVTGSRNATLQQSRIYIPDHLHSLSLNA